MRIVLNHLTRMDAPRICIAGVDPDRGRHIRPTTGPRDPLTRDLLADEGGPFELGALIELGEITPEPNPPETEDHLFQPNKATVMGRLSPNRYLELVGEHARHDLHAIFGDELVRHDWNYATDKHCGTVSLGILRVRRRPDLEVDRYGKLRLRLNHEGKPAFLSVTDVRFVEADHRPQDDQDRARRRRQGTHATRGRRLSHAGPSEGVRKAG